MSSQHQSYIELEEIITAYLDESEQSNHKYFKIWNLCFRGFTSLGIDYFWQIKSVKLPINSNLTVTMPPDWVSYSKIGVLNENGEIIPLYYNNNLTTYSDLQPQRIQQTQDPTLISQFQSNTPVWYNWWNGSGYSNLYGLPSGSPFVGSFKLDNANGVILLGENFGYDYLMVEYLASPVEGQQYYVPIHFKEAMISWLRWKDVISLPASSRRGQLGDKAMRRHEYYNDRRNAIASYRPIILSEAHQSNLEATRLTIKG